MKLIKILSDKIQIKSDRFEFRDIRINSLIAVKKLVFDEKKVTMQRLLDALDANFVGYEDVKKIWYLSPKYVNDDDEVN